ncbi:MAG: CxxC-x17-CxxC domain-containing protein [Patescibacteria group bacterium]|nr:CxxC-x17-CxxC domain-containing protein [Patescibacteria group bacterium]
MYSKKEMFPATCSQCGQACQVPFRPTSGKPVLCSHCFEKQKENQPNRSKRRDFRKGDRPMFSAVCDQCGQECQVPFRPTSGKPIYCNDCFAKEGRSGDRRGNKSWRGRSDRRNRDGAGNKQLAEQLKSLGYKLDKVISILEQPVVKKKSQAKKVKTKKPAPKKKTKKLTKKKSKKTAKKKP